MLTGLNHITIAVSDLNRAFAFYTEVLGLTPHVKWDTGAYLTAGDLWVCLSCDTVTPREDYTHIAFDIAPENFAAIKKRLIDSGVKLWKDNTSEGASLYILDPDGHKLEIHVGDLETRLATIRQTPYPSTIFYEPHK